MCRYDVILRCWHVHAWRRPNFDQLVSETSNIISAMMQHSRQYSVTRSSSSSVPADHRDADAADLSVRASDGVDTPLPADYLQPTPRCGDCVRQDAEQPAQSDHSADGSSTYARRRQPPPPPPSVVAGRPQSLVAYQVPPATSSVETNSDRLPWRCTAV